MLQNKLQVSVAPFYRSLKTHVTYSSQLHHQLWQLQYDQHVSNELYATCCRSVWRSLSPTLPLLFRIWKKTNAMFQPKATCRAEPGGNIHSYGRRVFSVTAPLLGTVFLSILGMLDHGTFLKDSWKLDCKTVGFFLKISKEIGKAWRKSLTRAKRASLTRP